MLDALGFLALFQSFQSCFTVPNCLICSDVFGPLNLLENLPGTLPWPFLADRMVCRNSNRAWLCYQAAPPSVKTLLSCSPYTLARRAYFVPMSPENFRFSGILSSHWC